MYKIIDESGNVYEQAGYNREADFEKMVVSHADAIFGKDGIYFDIKKLIGKQKKGATIPDGYYLDLTFHKDPHLYLVEVELIDHDVYAHIGEQLLRFGISSDQDKYRMKSILIEAISEDKSKQAKLDEYYKNSDFNNHNELLDEVIFKKNPAAIIVIDEKTDELTNVIRQLTMSVDIIEAQSYRCGDRILHRFTPFREDVLADIPVHESADDIDTIVIPAREEGFKEEFLNNERWFAIRISGSMIDKIKYIAAYQVAPISGITHIAEVKSIQKYNGTEKYILYFKEGTLKKINKVGLGKNNQWPQAPRYSSYKAIMAAKSTDDLWGEQS